MLRDIDILLTASCFKSAQSAERMAKSLKHVQGDTLLVLTSPLEQDIAYLKDADIENTVLFRSKIDNMYLCRNWGFVWAVANNFKPLYYCSCDDDIEFDSNSHDLLFRLVKNDFSVMTFLNRSHRYNIWKGEMVGTCMTVSWMNGDSMFTRFEDNLKYGLPDCLPNGEASPFCVESEYQQRMAVFTGKPLLADIEKQFYTHHYRDTDDKRLLRDVDVVARINSGLRFLRTNYDGVFGDNHIDINTANIHGITREYIQAHPQAAKRHLLMDGLWVDYKAMHEKYKDSFEEVM